MDGSFVRRTSVITGLGKLARLQEVPFNHYYSALAKDALDADVILVLGCGMGDLHVTAWLEQARKAKPLVPLLFVGYWGHDTEADSGFYSAMHFDQEDKEIEMMHKLFIDPRDVTNTGVGVVQGWTVLHESRAAIWHRGFRSFLEQPKAVEIALRAIQGAT